MWDLMKHRMRDARKGDMEESVNVVRPYSRQRAGSKDERKPMTRVKR